MSDVSAVCKKLGLWVLQGAAFALGFLLLITGILMAFGSFGFPGYSTSHTETSSHMETVSNLSEKRPSAEQLLITNLQEIKPSKSGSQTSGCVSMFGQYQFTGSIENKGPESGRYLNIFADLFDKDGGFIYQCQTQLQEPLKNGEKQNFMISCHGLPDSVAERYASYKVYTRGGGM